MTNSDSSPSLLNDSAKPYAGHGKTSIPFSLFIGMCISDSKHMSTVEILKIIDIRKKNRNDLLSAYSRGNLKFGYIYINTHKIYSSIYIIILKITLNKLLNYSVNISRSL